MKENFCSWLVLVVFLKIGGFFGNTGISGRNIYANRRISKLAGGRALLDCELVDAVLKKTGGKANYVAKLEWTKAGAVVASYSNGENGAQWWVASQRYKLDRSNFSLSISNIDETDSSIFVCNPTFDRTVDWIRLPTEEPEYVTLDVITAPTEPGRVRVTSYTARSVSLSWEESGTHPDFPVLKYLVTVSEGDEGNSKVVETLMSKRNHLIVPRLKPYTTYTFQAVGVNLVGTGRPGQMSNPVRTKGERPAEPPKIEKIINGTDTSLILTWEPPPISSLHGPLIGYRIMTHELRTGKRMEIYVDKPGVKSMEIQGLKVYTKYMISLEVDNNYGYSPAATSVVTTKEGVPTSGPVISSLTVLSSKAIQVMWAPPKQPNGRVTHYTLFYRSNTNERHDWLFVPAGNGEGVIGRKIEGLDPYTKYFVWVSASTKQGEGVPSETTFAYTDTDAPSTPTLANISMQGLRTVVVEWLEPVRVYRRVDSYMIKLTSEGDLRDNTGPKERRMNTTEPYVYFTAVALNTLYRLTVTALTRSIVQSEKAYVGPSSKMAGFLLKEEKYKEKKGISLVLYTSLCSVEGRKSEQIIGKNWNNEVIIICDPYLLNRVLKGNSEEETGSSSIIAVSIFATIGALIVFGICLLVGFLFYRRRKGETYISHGMVPALSHYEPYDESEFPPVSVYIFDNHVSSLHADGDAGFAREYEALDMEVKDDEDSGKLTSDHSSLSCNAAKNRYTNILAYDNSRVILKNPCDSRCNDYINANYVDGFHKPRAYIATQGPLPNTFGDFWRMVWEQRTLVIVMITNVIEKGRKKCDQYWPTEGSEIYGEQFEVRLLNEYHTAFYSVRMMSIKNLKAKTVRTVERLVFQYHYTHWPDHGVPSSPLPALTFIRKSAAANRDSAGPVIVHCSAGVGRSGTYIVIDSMLRQVKARNNVNIYAYLRHIRKQRNYLVQTEEQYIFCYEAILEAIRSENTEICSSNLFDYVNDALLNNGMALLQKQFEMITDQKSALCNEAKLPFNADKNRHPDILPVDDSRVTIALKPTIEGSDYVNASFFQGFHKLEEFIVTQCPLNATVGSFWEMVFDHNCQTMVLLCDTDEIFYKQFWPDLDGRNLEFPAFYVQTTDCASSDDWACVDLIVQSKEDDFQLPCRLLHYPGWPQHCPTLKNVWDLVQTVQDWHLEYQDGPVMVIDRYGGNPAATFCALSTLASQLELESSVDVYQVAKLYHNRRPGVFPTAGDYRYLYDCLLCLLKTESMDENFNSADGTINKNQLRDSGSKFKLSLSVPNGLKGSNTRNSTDSTFASKNSSEEVEGTDSPLFLLKLQNGERQISRDTTL